MIPGLTQWVKDPTLPQAAAQVSDVARRHGVSVAVALAAAASIPPQPGNFYIPQAGATLKRRKEKKLKISLTLRRR